MTCSTAATLDATADLAVRDPGWGLDLALDDERLTAWAAERGVGSVRRRYLRYKPGTSVVVGLDLADGPAWLLATAPDGAAKVAKRVERAPAGSVLAHDVDRGLLLARPEADADLRALRDPAALLRVLLPDAPDDAGLRPLVHKPQRRWVGLAVDGDRPLAVLRAYRPSAGRAAIGRHLLLEDEGIGPRVLGHDARTAALALAFVPGRPLEPTSGAHDHAAAGAALARLHLRRPVGVGARRRDTHRASAELVAHLLPGSAAAAHELAARIEDRLARAAARGDDPVLCHGDFSPDQVLVDDTGQVRVIDWDAVTTGPAAWDLASAEASGLPAAAVAALHDGYARVRRLPPDLDAHVAAAVLRRAPEPFRLARPDWSTQVEAALEAASERLR